MDSFDNVRVYMKADHGESTTTDHEGVVTGQFDHSAATIVEFKGAYPLTWGGYLCIHLLDTDVVIGEFPIGEWAGVERF